MHGKLFAYLREEFQGFLRQMSTLAVHINLLNINAMMLPRILMLQLYERIEVIILAVLFTPQTDTAHRSQTYQMQTKMQNANATIITCYLNAVMEIV